MLDKLKRLMGAESASDSTAAIQAAIAEIDLTSMAEARTLIAAERQSLLLTGSDAQVLDAEERLTKARLDEERAAAALDELHGRLTQARTKEVEDAYLDHHRQVTSARSAWAAKARRELPKLEATLTSIFVEGQAVAQQIRALDRLRRPHENTGDVVDQSQHLPMPGEEFGVHDPYVKDPYQPWLMQMLREHVNLPKI